MGRIKTCLYVYINKIRKKIILIKSQGVYDFENKVFQNLQAKIIQNKTLTGEMFLNLTCEYVEAINNGGIPQILTSIERVISSETRKIMENCNSEYEKQVF